MTKEIKVKEIKKEKHKWWHFMSTNWSRETSANNRKPNEKTETYRQYCVQCGWEKVTITITKFEL